MNRDLSFAIRRGSPGMGCCLVALSWPPRGDGVDHLADRPAEISALSFHRHLLVPPQPRTRRRALTVEPSREALSRITEIYAQLKPLEQKELFRLVLKRAEVSERKMVLELYGDALLESVQGESLQAQGRKTL